MLQAILWHFPPHNPIRTGNLLGVENETMDKICSEPFDFHTLAWPIAEVYNKLLETVCHGLKARTWEPERKISHCEPCQKRISSGCYTCLLLSPLLLDNERHYSWRAHYMQSGCIAFWWRNALEIHRKSDKFHRCIVVVSTTPYRIWAIAEC